MRDVYKRQIDALHKAHKAFQRAGGDLHGIADIEIDGQRSRLFNAHLLHFLSSCLLYTSDGRHADQQVRGAVVLPNGTGKNVRVVAICKGDAAKAAEAAGAQAVSYTHLCSVMNPQRRKTPPRPVRSMQRWICCAAV